LLHAPVDESTVKLHFGIAHEVVEPRADGAVVCLFENPIRAHAAPVEVADERANDRHDDVADACERRERAAAAAVAVVVVVNVDVGVRERARRVAASYIYEVSHVSICNLVTRTCSWACESAFTLHYDSSPWQTSNPDAPKSLALPY